MIEWWPVRNTSFLKPGMCSELWSGPEKGTCHGVTSVKSVCFDVEAVIKIEGVKVGPKRTHVGLQNFRSGRTKPRSSGPSDSGLSVGAISDSDFALVFEKPGQFKLPFHDIARIRSKHLHKGKASIEGKGCVVLLTAVRGSDLERLMQFIRDVKDGKGSSDLRLCSACQEKIVVQNKVQHEREELLSMDSLPAPKLDVDYQATKKQKVKVLECIFRKKLLSNLVSTGQDQCYGQVKDCRAKNKSHVMHKMRKMGLLQPEGSEARPIVIDDFSDASPKSEDISPEGSPVQYFYDAVEEVDERPTSPSMRFGSFDDRKRKTSTDGARRRERQRNMCERRERDRAFGAKLSEEEKENVYGRMDDEARKFTDETARRIEMEKRRLNEENKMVQERVDERKRVLEDKRRLKEQRRIFLEEQERSSILESEERRVEEERKFQEERIPLDARKQKIEERLWKLLVRKLQEEQRRRAEKLQEIKKLKKEEERSRIEQAERAHEEKTKLLEERQREEEERRQKDEEKKIQELERQKEEESKKQREEEKRQKEEKRIQELKRQRDEEIRQKEDEERRTKELRRQKEEEERRVKVLRMQKEEEEWRLKEDEERRIQESREREDCESRLKREEKNVQDFKELREEEKTLLELRKQVEESDRRERERDFERKILERVLEQKRKEEEERKKQEASGRFKLEEDRQRELRRKQEGQRQSYEDARNVIPETKQKLDEPAILFEESKKRVVEEERKKEDMRRRIEQQRKLQDDMKRWHNWENNRKGKVDEWRMPNPQSSRECTMPEDQRKRTEFIEVMNLSRDLARKRMEEAVKEMEERRKQTEVKVDEEGEAHTNEMSLNEQDMKILDDGFREVLVDNGNDLSRVHEVLTNWEREWKARKGNFENLSSSAGQARCISYLFMKLEEKKKASRDEQRRFQKNEGQSNLRTDATTEAFTKVERTRQAENQRLRQVILDRKKAEKAASALKKKLLQEQLKAATMEAKRLEKESKEAEKRAKAAERLQKQKSYQDHCASATAATYTRGMPGIHRVKALTYQQYEDSWNTIVLSRNTGTLGFYDIPWPPEGNPLFIGQGDTLDAQKHKLRVALLRWHPDKFMAIFGRRLSFSEKDHIESKAKKLALEVIQWKNKLGKFVVPS